MYSFPRTLTAAAMVAIVAGSMGMGIPLESSPWVLRFPGEVIASQHIRIHGKRPPVFPAPLHSVDTVLMRLRFKAWLLPRARGWFQALHTAIAQIGCFHHVVGSWRLVDKLIVTIAGPQRNLALFDFFVLVSPTDPLGFLESGFLGTSFSIKNSLPHWEQLRRDIKSLSMIVPTTRGIRQCGQ
jgi:hypothetical protein